MSGQTLPLRLGPSSLRSSKNNLEVDVRLRRKTPKSDSQFDLESLDPSASSRASKSNLRRDDISDWDGRANAAEHREGEQEGLRRRQSITFL